MNLTKFLQALIIQGWKFWNEDDRLFYDAPSDQSISEVLIQLKQHKGSIIKLLQEESDILNVHPLSHGQKALWFIWQLEPESAAYNQVFSARICDDLDVDLLRSVFLELVERHPCLRSTFPKIGEQPIQQIHQNFQLNWKQIDACSWDETELYSQVIAESKRPFDLEKEAIIRIRLFTISPSEHILLISIHHIVTDGWSLDIILSELPKLYQAKIDGVCASLTTLKNSYSDYVSSQNEMLEGAEGEKLLRYWQEQLQGELPVLNLHTDKPRPPIQTYNGASINFKLSKQLTHKLKQLAIDSDATLYMTLLAAFQVLLYRYTGTDDILVASPVAGRFQSQFRDIVGYFANLVVLRGNLSNNPNFREFLNQIHQTVNQALTHQNYPFALLVEKLQPQRDSSRSPILQAAFALQQLNKSRNIQNLFINEIEENIDWGGLKLRPFEIPMQEGQNDLDLELIEGSSSIKGSFKYNTDLFNRETIKRMAAHFQNLLEAIVENPQLRVSEIQLLTDYELTELLLLSNNIATNYQLYQYFNLSGSNNLPVYILDENQKLVPLGVEGEIYLGNWDLPLENLNSETKKYVNLIYHPQLGKLLKTGEWGHLRGDASLELLGKAHRIVKLKGQRINLQRIEKALLTVVKDCYVMVRNQELVAYIVKEGNFEAEFLNNHLKSQLPSYPLPYTYVQVSALPLTGSGEVNRENLANIAVIDSHLITTWEEQIASELEIDKVAVFIEPNVKTIPPIHLEKLLPSTQAIFNQVSTVVETLKTTEEENYSSSLEIKSPAISHGEALIFPESAPKTLGEMLQQIAGKFPHNGITYINSDGSESVQSYAQLLEDAQRILGGLRKLGLKPEDKVIFQFKENKDFISAFWGCILGGFIPVAVGIPTSYDQSNTNLNKLQNSWLLLEKPLVLTDNKSLLELNKWAINLNLENFNLEAIESLYQVAADKNYYNSQPEDLAILLLTSGSTGTPKAVKQSHQSLLSRSAGTIAMNNFTPEDISLNWFPLDHVGGIVMFHLRDVMTGCQQIHAPTQMVLQAPTLWLDWISKYRVTTTWAPNFAYGLIIEELEKLNHNSGVKADYKWDLSSLKFILNAGEAIIAKTTRKFLELLIPYQLSSQVMHPAWGMSETSSAVTFADNFLLELTTDEQKFVELGSPIPGFSIRIVDNQNQVIEEGKTGFVQVKGASVTSGYYQNSTANKEAFTEDGWFNTGDLGFIQEGCLTITGRKKDVIIINGANYYSHEIEAAVEELSFVEVSYTAACGVSVAGNNTEELVIFFSPCVSSDNELSSLLKKIREQVVTHCGINPSYLIPVKKEIIPKTSIGKIQRSLLKQRFIDGEFKSIRQQVDLLLGNANTISNWFYRKVWQTKQNQKTLLTYSPNKILTLIFADNLGFATKLTQELSQQNQPYVQVTIGSDFARISPNHYSLVPGNPQHYRFLIDSLMENNQVIDQILHLWDYQEQTEEISSLENLELTQQQGVYSLLFLVQALEKIQGTQEAVKLLWIANNSQYVNFTDKIEPQKATVFGLLKTVTQEKPWLITRHLDLPLTAELNSSYIWQELYSTDNDLEVAIRNGERFVSRLESVDMIDCEKQEIPIKPGGTYLLTGGLGEIGTIIAKYLLENYQANLILVGRTQLENNNEELTTKIRQYQELKKLPGSVIYQAVDICDLVGLQKVVEKATKQWGTQLDGILHMAGILQENSIEQETPDNIAAVLRPKVSGTWVLHQLLKNKENALFVHFCSVNGFFGGANVAAYSAANSFQSAWGDYQQQNGFHSLCYSWSMWNETGMSKGYQFQQLSGAKGYFAINPQQGINSFLAALSHPEHNLLIGLDGTKANIEHLIDECQPKQKLTAYFTSSIQDAALSLQKVKLHDCFGIPNQVDFTQLEQIPLTETGEINREQLAAIYGGLSTGEQTKPQNETQRQLVEIFQEVLNLVSVGIDDNFFSLGGHSLLATQLISRVRETFSIEIPLGELFSSPTVAKLDQTLTQLRNTNNGLTATSIQPRTETEQLPLSWAQERLWFLNQLEGKSATYNMSGAFRVSSNLDIDALQKALSSIVKRHEALRTSFCNVNGTPIQVIHPDATIKINLVDLQQLETTKQENLVLSQVKLEATTPFDLENAPLIRCSLLQLSASEYVLLLTMHHIVSDGWSIGVFIQELSSLYQAFTQGVESPLAELPIQYADFAVWQRKYLTAEVLSTQLDYWKLQLSGVPDLLQLPTDFPRPAVQTYQGRTQSFSINTDLTTKLQTLSRESDTTLFMTLYAAFSTLLYRYSGQSDILIGTPIANRNRSEIEGLIGFFVNTLVLRTQFENNPSFKQLLAQVRETTLKAYSHQDVAFETVVEALQPQRSLSHSPLFQVMFVLQNAPMGDVELPGVTLSPIELESTIAKFDLTLSITETEQGLVGKWEYSTDLFNEQTIERMVAHFHNLLEAIVENPLTPVGNFNFLSESERHQLLVEWNDTATEYPKDKCIHQLFEEQVEKTPNAIAVVFESEQLTYEQLNQRANQLAHHLQTLGVKPEVLVGICVERSIEMVVGLLGILKAGGAYVPFDPNYPQERISLMLSDSDVGVLVTQSSLVEFLPEHNAQVLCLDTDWGTIEQQSQSNLNLGVISDNLAYVIYTSGSTGKPKGVSVVHQGVVRLVKENNYVSFSTQEVFLQLAPISFDASTFEIWGSLLNGAKLVVMYAHTPSLEDIAGVIEKYKVTTLWLTAALFNLMVEQHLSKLKSVRQLLAGGDVLSSFHVEKVIKFLPECQLINGYGPTENTTFTCCYPIQKSTENGTSVPIGRPIANTQTYILDSHLQPVPVGVSGELHIGGDGLARGYLNRPQLTSEKFIPNPFDKSKQTAPTTSKNQKSKLYKTGDLARYLPDGNITFMGRIDNQVKIRGFRIELGEIEALLAKHPQINQAVVIATEENTDNKRLVAYSVADSEITTQQLRHYVKAQLPEYMVPSVFVILDTLPITANGKIDRKALPTAEIERDTVYTAPRTQSEEIIANIFAQVLNVENIGIHDNFFELGGHSLLATQLISRVRETFSIEIPLQELFSSPTVAQLDQILTQLRNTNNGLTFPPIQPRTETGEFRLSWAQERLWFLNQLEGKSATYNIPAALRISGNLDINALQKALSSIVKRHEALRTSFCNVNGTPIQVIHPEATMKINLVDLQQLETIEQETLVIEQGQEEATTPFSLENAPLIRCRLLQLSTSEYVFLLTMHHIVSDGWSIGVFIQELSSLYQAFTRGVESPLTQLPIQYADFAVWQRQWLSGELLETQLNYWKQQLHGAPDLLQLPTDYPRPKIQTYRGATQNFTLNADLTQKLQTLSRQSGTTLFMTLLAGFQLLLKRYTNQDDIIVGTDVANRNRAELEPLIGFFVNLLALRTDLSGNPSFRELLQQVRHVALEAYDHQELPFEKLVEALQPSRELSYSPIFQVLFVLQNTPMPALELPGVTLEFLEGKNETTKFDLGIFIRETEQGIEGSCQYRTELFKSSTIKTMLAHFEVLLNSIVAQPDTRINHLEMRTDKEKEQQMLNKNLHRASKFKKFMKVQPKAVDLSQDRLVKTDYFAPGEALPLVITPNVDDLNIMEWAKNNRNFIEKNLLQNGAILFRNFGVNSIAGFESFNEAICPELFGEYGDLPREEVSGKVYGSTPYPEEEAILFHSESSHMHCWPNKIWFFCAQAAQQGGETPIVDCRKLFKLLDPKLREKFEQKQLMYVRNYIDGLDVSWQDFFHTSDKAIVEDYCRQAGMEFEWLSGNGLRTKSIRAAVIKHPKTGEQVFFNQLQLHHVSCLKPAVRESLLSTFSEENLPRNVYYGDGSPIEDSVIAEISAIYQEAKVAFGWQKGDILMLDNMLTAHGRNPYVGPRKTVVAMAQMIYGEELTEK